MGVDASLDAGQSGRGEGLVAVADAGAEVGPVDHGRRWPVGDVGDLVTVAAAVVVLDAELAPLGQRPGRVRWRNTWRASTTWAQRGHQALTWCRRLGVRIVLRQQMTNIRSRICGTPNAAELSISGRVRVAEVVELAEPPAERLAVAVRAPLGRLDDVLDDHQLGPVGVGVADDARHRHPAALRRGVAAARLGSGPSPWMWSNRVRGRS